MPAEAASLLPTVTPTVTPGTAQPQLRPGVDCTREPALPMSVAWAVHSQRM